MTSTSEFKSLSGCCVFRFTNPIFWQPMENQSKKPGPWCTVYVPGGGTQSESVPLYPHDLYNIYIINYICVCVDSKLPTSIIIHPHLINHGSLNPIKFPGIFRPNFRTSLEVLPQLSRYLPRSSQRVTDDIPGEAHEMEISIP